MIDAGYNYDRLAVKSLTLLEKKLRKRGLHPLFITGHTGWTDNMDFAFAHKNELCSPFKKRVHAPMRFTMPMMNPMILRKKQRVGA